MDYQNPGDAFSNTFSNVLMQQEQMKRQAMLDEQKRQQIAQQMQHQQEEMEMARQALQDRRDKAASDLNDKEYSRTVNDVGRMIPGDIPDADLLGRAKKHHIMLRMSEPTPGTPEVPGQPIPGGGVAIPGEPPQPVLHEDQISGGMTPPPSQASPEIQNMLARAPQGTVNPADEATPSAPPAMTPPTLAKPAMPAVYLGSSADVMKDRKQKENEDLMGAILNMEPGSPEYYNAVNDYKSRNGMKIEAPKVKPTPEVRENIWQDPRTGAIKRQDDQGNWVPQVGPIPANANIMNTPSPHDTSAGDRAEKNHVDAVRHQELQAFNAKAKPLEETSSRLNKMSLALKQGTSIGDSTIAEQVVTLMAGGNGSGVRISKPLVDQVLLRTNTNWENLDLALKRWVATGMAPDSLILTDNQRQAIRNLMEEGRRLLNEKATKMLGIRSKISHATSSDDIYTESDNLQKLMLEDDAPVDESKPAKGKAITAEDAEKMYRSLRQNTSPVPVKQ